MAAARMPNVKANGVPILHPLERRESAQALPGDVARAQSFRRQSRRLQSGPAMYEEAWKMPTRRLTITSKREVDIEEKNEVVEKPLTKA